MDRMLGLPPDEHAAFTALALALGSDFRLEHETRRDALLGEVEELRVRWDGGAVVVSAQIMHFAIERDDDDGEGPAYTVDRLGPVHTWTRVPLPWWHWRSLLGRLRR